MVKGLSEEHAQIALELCQETFRGFVPKSRFDAVNHRLKEANEKLVAGQEKAPIVCTYPEQEQITIQITMNGRKRGKHDD